MAQQGCSEFLDRIDERHPNQPEYVQAVREVVADVWELVEQDARYRRARVLERLTEPDRSVSFRVSWEDDSGGAHVARGYRVQTCNALGPYKGGLRFHPSVNESILKFLGFEQTFKNSLTGLPIGAGKGGADFDPRKRSDAEVRRFCQAFMIELLRDIGPETDVPAGDIGVGDREIGYLFGQYKRSSGNFAGALTGKPLAFGGSELRSEATGFGVVYFTAAVLERAGETLDGKRCAVSGAGNVATYCARKLLEEGGTVVSLSDSGGTLAVEDGLSNDHLDWLGTRGRRLHDLAEEFGLAYREDSKPWSLECDLAFPCATQNELDAADARGLVDGGCGWIVEGANMPCDPEAHEIFAESKAVLCPGKAANAGGVAVSALEMSQNASFQRWTRKRVDKLLRGVMGRIHHACADQFEDADRPDYVRAANRAGFIRVAEALVAQGIG